MRKPYDDFAMISIHIYVRVQVRGRQQFDFATDVADIDALFIKLCESNHRSPADSRYLYLTRRERHIGLPAQPIEMDRAINLAHLKKITDMIDGEINSARDLERHTVAHFIAAHAQAVPLGVDGQAVRRIYDFQLAVIYIRQSLREASYMDFSQVGVGGFDLDRPIDVRHFHPRSGRKPVLAADFLKLPHRLIRPCYRIWG